MKRYLFMLTLLITAHIFTEASDLYAFSEDSTDGFIYYELYDSNGWFMSYAIPNDSSDFLYIASHRTSKEWFQLGPSSEVKIQRNQNLITVKLNDKIVFKATKSKVIVIRPEGSFTFTIR